MQNNTKVLMLGGTGFIGQQLCHELTQQGCKITVLSRQASVPAFLKLLPAVQCIQGDIQDFNFLKEHCQSKDVLINLVGILDNGHQPENSFQNIHVELNQKLSLAIQGTAIQQVIYFSALNADASSPLDYLRTKGQAELIWQKHHQLSPIRILILRPAVVLGQHSSFLKRLNTLIDWMPILCLPCAQTQYQPIFIRDLTTALRAHIHKTGPAFNLWEAAGPQILTFQALVRLLIRSRRKSRLLLPMGSKMSDMLAWTLERLPGRLFSRAEKMLASMDSIGTGNNCPDLPQDLVEPDTFFGQLYHVHR